jgi:hypothetical protein
MPRITSSIGTPACEARYKASMTDGSTSAFILTTMRAARPSRALRSSRSMSAMIRSRRPSGATTSFFQR